MRVAFAGTPAFAATALSALLEAGFDVPLVLTQPDRPRGRGMKLEPSPVKTLAQDAGLRVLQPATLRTEEARVAVLAVPVDVLVVAAYGLILPPAILGWPRHGCINIHASLLPRWRGAAPIHRAILAGDAESGVTIMQMDAGLDTGPILDVARLAIGERETTGELHDRLAALGADLIVGTLRRLARDGRIVAAAQPADGVTYAAKIERADSVVDWRDDAVAIDRRLRALSPAPGAATALGGEPLKLWRARPRPSTGVAAPGTVVDAGGEGIVVACGTGELVIDELQLAGGRRMGAAAFVAGRKALAGMRLGGAG